MTSLEQTPDPGESVSRQRDEICDRFEAEWKSGAPPRIEEYAEQLPSDTDGTLLQELLKLDIRYRLQRGQSPTADEYTKRFPEHDALIREKLSQCVS